MVHKILSPRGTRGDYEIMSVRVAIPVHDMPTGLIQYTYQHNQIIPKGV